MNISYDKIKETLKTELMSFHEESRKNKLKIDELNAKYSKELRALEANGSEITDAINRVTDVIRIIDAKPSIKKLRTVVNSSAQATSVNNNLNSRLHELIVKWHGIRQVIYTTEELHDFLTQEGENILLRQLQKKMQDYVQRAAIMNVRYGNRQPTLYGPHSWFIIRGKSDSEVKKEHDQPHYSATHGVKLPATFNGIENNRIKTARNYRAKMRLEKAIGAKSKTTKE